jgi:iron-sulfur cluster repair protein YtfE (RIC family)
MADQQPFVEAGVNDPIAKLKRDHREAEELLTKLEDSSPGPRRRANVDKLVQALTLHMEIEERLVYPLVAANVGQEDAEEAEIEHGLAREALMHLRDMVDKPGFGATVSMLKAGIKHHVKEEEREIFPKLKRKMERTDLAELGDQAMAMKSGRGGRTRPPAGRSSRSASNQRRPARKATGTRTRSRVAS